MVAQSAAVTLANSANCCTRAILWLNPFLFSKAFATGRNTVVCERGCCSWIRFNMCTLCVSNFATSDEIPGNLALRVTLAPIVVMATVQVQWGTAALAFNAYLNSCGGSCSTNGYFLGSPRTPNH